MEEHLQLRRAGVGVEARTSGVLLWVAKFQKPIGHLSGDDRQATDYPSPSPEFK